MPLRCIEPDGHSLQSFDLADAQWQRLKLENRKAAHLRMPCCKAPVVFKQSNRGRRFFAHKQRGLCTSARESDEHLLLKELAVQTAREAGWRAATEVVGTTDLQESWTADVFAKKGPHKIAVEIQWSGQTNAESLRRQSRYKKAGVRCLWLLRQPGFPITRDLPAVCIGGSLESGFDALLPWHQMMTARDRGQPYKWQQVMPMRKFLSAAFEGRFRFGVPQNAQATVVVHSGTIHCWRNPCTACTRIVTLIEVAFGPHKYGFTVPTLGFYPELLSCVLTKLPLGPDMSKIERRYSRQQNRSYMSNGCCVCGALIGEFHEGEALDSGNEVLATFPIRISEKWQAAITRHSDGPIGWGVYSPSLANILS
jgi:hypothetical protein